MGSDLSPSSDTLTQRVLLCSGTVPVHEVNCLHKVPGRYRLKSRSRQNTGGEIFARFFQALSFAVDFVVTKISPRLV